MTTPRRRTSGRRRGAGSSTPTMWWNQQSAENILGAGASQSFQLANPTDATMPGTFQAGFTVVRMILDVILRANANNQALFGAYGVFVNTALSAIDTILDLYDYYVHQNWTQISVNANDTAQAYVRRYDIRTARRVRGEQRSLSFAITNNSGSAGSVIWAVSARCLLKGS